uniref:Rab-like protein 6 n=1 Tax=Trichobilharzia regenti TaxID=157069 RepID=A0AA85J7D1_TRIRE|nr:unnamed protein product [Trichobilharzia regenti]
MSVVKNWWTKNDATTVKKHTSSDIQPIGAFLQQKFSRGVDYNLKIVIRGDRNVGKSTLLSRLKGEQFKEEYIPSNEIQLANIHWNHKNSQSVIKVEVWDVVDKGKPRNTSKGLKFFSKLTNNNQTSGNITGESAKIEPCLDASFINVYKGAHGVILMMDMTKPWTFDYVCRELVQIPAKLPVLIMSNFYDMHENRKITEEQVRVFLDTVEVNGNYSVSINGIKNSIIEPVVDTEGYSVQNISSTRRSIPVQYCESSMKTGLGLMYVYKFLNLPFLCLQRDVLHYQLKRNHSEMMNCLYELSPKGGETPEQRFSYMDSSEAKATGCSASSSVSRNITSPISSFPPSSSSSASSSSTFHPASSHAINNDVVSIPTFQLAKTMETINSLKLSNANNSNSINNTIPMKINHNEVKSNESSKTEQNPMVIGFSEDVDPADIEIYYCNDDSESSLTSYTYIHQCDDFHDDNEENGCTASANPLNKDLSHAVVSQLQLNQLEGQTDSMNTSNRHILLESEKDLITNSGLEQSRTKSKKGSIKEEEQQQQENKSTPVSGNNALSVFSENITMLPTDSDALEKFLEDT